MSCLLGAGVWLLAGSGELVASQVGDEFILQAGKTAFHLFPETFDVRELHSGGDWSSGPSSQVSQHLRAVGVLQDVLESRNGEHG